MNSYTRISTKGNSDYYVCIMCVISKSMSACNGNCAQTIKTTISFCKYFCIIICQTRKA